MEKIQLVLMIIKPNEKVLIMFGSEADGLSDELKNFATTNVTIEMAPFVESA